MKATKIDWCDCTVNPVVGCKNGCQYCYAEKINDRFKFIPCWRKPQFFEDRLNQLKSKKPKSVFMDSMSDIGWWEKVWCEKVFNAIQENPQHNYIFLTKSYRSIIASCIKLGRGRLKNVFFGATITTTEQLKNYRINAYEPFDFLSVEPLLEPINFRFDLGAKPKLIIIGAETGTRKDKVIPKKEWVDDIVKQCDKAKVAVFMKESLREIMGNDFRQDKLLWDIGE